MRIASWARRSRRRRRSRQEPSTARVIAFEAVSPDGQLRIHGARPSHGGTSTLMVPTATDVPVHVTIGHRRPVRAGRHLSTAVVDTPDGELRFDDGATVHAGLIVPTTHSRLEIYVDQAPGATQVDVVLEATGEPR